MYLGEAVVDVWIRAMPCRHYFRVLKFEWFEPDTETTVASGTIAGGSKHAFAAPVRSGGLVLYIHTS